MNALSIDLAQPGDAPAINSFIMWSARTLCAKHYEPAALSAALRHVFQVDSRLIGEGCYHVARVRGEVIGCGGWSPFAMGYGTASSDRPLDPRREPARIGAFFVSPDWTRAGVGTALLATCEGAAILAGFSRFESVSTLSGVPFYQAAGYHFGRERIDSFGGTRVRFVEMRKDTHQAQHADGQDNEIYLKAAS